MLLVCGHPALDSGYTVGHNIWRCWKFVCRSLLLTRSNSIAEVPPTHRLLVIVNPHSGTRKAMKVYNSVVRPMFDVAQLEVDVIRMSLASPWGDSWLT